MTQFNPERIKAFLNTRRLGRSILYFEEVESTNDIAFELAKGDAEEGLCVIAERQKRGRGRLKRQWFSPPFKNLYLSVILRPSVQVESLYPFSFLSSLATYETLRGKGIIPSLKWPNDVLIGKKKVSGSLIEIGMRDEILPFLICGVGINVNMEETDIEDELRGMATSLYMEKGEYFEREEICGIFLNELEKFYQVLEEKGGKEIVTIFEDKANIRGRRISFERNGERVFGVVIGLTEEGALMIETSGRIEYLYAGDIAWSLS